MAWKVEPGTLFVFGGTTAPRGFLLADGSAVSRATYFALFAVIGTTWGAGDGSTTFNLPDMRGRVPIGAGAGPGLTARAIGAVGGEEAHVLSTAEAGPHAHTIPAQGAHAHGLSDPHHSHGMAFTTYTAAESTTNGNWIFCLDPAQASETTGNGLETDGSGNNIFRPVNISVAAGGAGIANTNSTAASAGHQTMQPHACLNGLIKT